MKHILDLRTIDMSLYDFISTKLSTDGFTVLSGHSYPYVVSGIYLVDGRPAETTNMGLPTISIEHIFSTEQPFQLGPGRSDKRMFEIDVYARSNGERDDLGERIRIYLGANSVSVYDYNLIVTGGISSILASARAEDITLNTLVGNIPMKAMQYVMRITFSLTIDIGSGYSLII